MKGFVSIVAVVSALVASSHGAIESASSFCNSTDYMMSGSLVSANGLLACWKQDGSDYEIRLQINSGFWGALGLSTTSSMPGTDVYWLSYDGTTITNQNRWASIKDTPTVETDPTYMVVQSTESDGSVAQLVFKRPIVGGGVSGHRLSMATAQFVLMATGVAPQAYHNTDRKVTASTVDFSGTAPTSPPTTSSPTTSGSTNVDTALCTTADVGSVDTAIVPAIAANGVKACWKADGSDYIISLTVNSGFWGAMGISSNDKMPNTDIYWISYDGSAVTVQNRYASAQSTPAVETDPTYLEIITQVADGSVAQVTFKRPAAASGNRMSMTTPAFVLIATGAAPQSYHGGNKLASSSAQDFSVTGASTASLVAFSTTKKMAHGAMMVFAWLFLGPTAMFDARFMKDVLGPTWFNIHALMMMVTVVLTLLGIIIIASDETVEYDSLLDESLLHARIGIAVMVLAFIQMLLGIFRKKISAYVAPAAGEKDNHDHGPRRWLFNYMHWFLGLLLLILTLVNVYSGFGLSTVDGGWVKAPVKDFYWVAVGLALGCFVVIELLKIPGRLNKDKGMDETVKLISRHAFALVSAAALASAITITTIIADSTA